MIDLQRTVLGIELGSTRIKAVLIDERHIPVAQGDYEWENRLVNGIWTYSMDAVHTGIQTCFARLRADVKEKCGAALTTVGAIGVSAMMHGYLPFDAEGKQLAEFRTWRNTITGEAAAELTELFNCFWGRICSGRKKTRPWRIIWTSVFLPMRNLRP